MAIIHCPACNGRMSSLARACPHCHEPIGELDQAERDKLAFRRWRAQLYRARNVSYVSMALVVIGMLVWWMTPPQGLVPPAGTTAAVLMGGGLIGYLGSWGWMLWLRYMRAPNRPG